METNSILMQIGLLVVGGVVGFVVNHLGGFSKEYFDERKRVGNHRREVARKVLDICTIDINDRLDRTVFTDEPSKFNKTIADLTPLDNELGEKLKVYCEKVRDGDFLLIPPDPIIDEYRADLMVWASAVRVGKAK